MRIAIVDDIETERALLKMRLERQLSLYGVETEILEFDSSESSLAAEKERHFTAARKLSQQKKNGTLLWHFWTFT